MRVKICGITQLKQAQAIADLGIDLLGFICFPPSPRYLNPEGIKDIIRSLPSQVQSVGVFVDVPRETIGDIVRETGLTAVQLHGHESPEFCLRLREYLTNLEIIKAVRVKDANSLLGLEIYSSSIDTLLLDAYTPNSYGGTGQTIALSQLQSFRSPLPWLLAGGLTPENVVEVLNQVQPDGIDLSSGVERSPGDKDIDRVALLLEQLRDYGFRN